ncbi:MAG: hypothetical protein Q9P90_09650 [candidate division KSB1 bacterium]|nr:hypothetical protein [candidate division KSB1 bacterium]
MKEIQYNDLVENPLKILELIRSGEKILIKKNKSQNLAVILPFNVYQEPDINRSSTKRPLGILKDKASYKINKDFKITDGEFLAS